MTSKANEKSVGDSNVGVNVHNYRLANIRIPSYSFGFVDPTLQVPKRTKYEDNLIYKPWIDPINTSYKPHEDNIIN